MSFASLTFIVFLLAALAVYYALRGRRAQIAWLIGASYFFYGWWDWRFCGLLLTSTLVDYAMARELGKPGSSQRKRRLCLAASVVTNLGILGFFKYFNFFVGSMEALLAQLGYEGSTTTLSILLPVGISFYTFQSMGYTIDVFRGRLRPVRRFDIFALYVCYFPQLVAGPIERGERLLPQIARDRRIAPGFIASGLWLMLLGFFKKVVLADNFGAMADPAFAHPDAFTAGGLLRSLYFFAFQIYFDFSGYTDIARGCSRLLGIELCVNFRQPYFSRNVAEFWRRWHVSLSTWLRDYLYVPLGGNRHGPHKTYCNLMIVMLLGGLWHGASWNFVAWGGLHGSYLVAHRLWRSRSPRAETPSSGLAAAVSDLFSMVAVFHLVAVTWLFFRVPDMESAWIYLSGMLSFQGGLHPINPGVVFGFAILLALDLLPYRSEDHDFPLRWTWTRQAAIYTSMILALLLFGGPDAPFIYFQF